MSVALALSKGLKRVRVLLLVRMDSDLVPKPLFFRYPRQCPGPVLPQASFPESRGQASAEHEFLTQMHVRILPHPAYGAGLIWLRASDLRPLSAFSEFRQISRTCRYLNPGGGAFFGKFLFLLAGWLLLGRGLGSCLAARSYGYGKAKCKVLVVRFLRFERFSRRLNSAGCCSFHNLDRVCPDPAEVPLALFGKRCARPLFGRWDPPYLCRLSRALVVCDPAVIRFGLFFSLPVCGREAY